MPINVNNPEADALTRKFAEMAGVGITDALVIAMRGGDRASQSRGDAIADSCAPAGKAWDRDERRRPQASPP
nr:type II toxin-antitoxin system VapB family antitoxin [Sinorhizobium fredii]